MHEKRELCSNSWLCAVRWSRAEPGMAQQKPGLKGPPEDASCEQQQLLGCLLKMQRELCPCPARAFQELHGGRGNLLLWAPLTTAARQAKHSKFQQQKLLFNLQPIFIQLPKLSCVILVGW